MDCGLCGLQSCWSLCPREWYSLLITPVPSTLTILPGGWSVSSYHFYWVGPGDALAIKWDTTEITMASSELKT